MRSSLNFFIFLTRLRQKIVQQHFSMNWVWKLISRENDYLLGKAFFWRKCKKVSQVTDAFLLQRGKLICSLKNWLPEMITIEAKQWHFTFPFIDPLGQPTVTAGRDHGFAPVVCPSVCPSVRPHFSKSSKTKQSENKIRYWRDCGSGRVDHWHQLLSCLLSFFLNLQLKRTHKI